jgi:TonB-linked SusC/RagA family outer membrane protein
MSVLLLCGSIQAARPVSAKTLVHSPAFRDTLILQGRISSAADLHPLAGATVSVDGTSETAVTDHSGHFMLPVSEPTGNLRVGFVGYSPLGVPYDFHAKKFMDLRMSPAEARLKEVIVSTGYQNLSEQRATGSFTEMDSAVLQRTVATDVISRLDGVTSGLVFNHNPNSAANSISIRGMSTIFANDQPLIVLDNFPYSGDLADINPADVDHITILKDAAAASIWGARAGNGVIVITTKKGRFNTPIRVEMNANVTIGDKPDLFYIPTLSAADYIGVEQTLFNEGFYQGAQNSYNQQPLTPVVELLFAAQNGQIDSASAANQINALKTSDVRKDFEKYFYRRSITQQYSVNLTGGTQDHQFYMSAGYDNNQQNLVGDGYSRKTLNLEDSYALLNHRLSIQAGLNYAESLTLLNNPGYGGIDFYNGIPLYPYASLAGPSGNPLAIVHDYDFPFVQAAPSSGLQNWQYAPLEELRLSNNTVQQDDYRIKLGARYQLRPFLSAQVLYQYEKVHASAVNDHVPASYFTRNLINEYTQINPDSTLYQAIPPGGILDVSDNITESQNARGQLNFDRQWGKSHEIAALAGMEMMDQEYQSSSYRNYGYQDQYATSQPVDYVTQFPLYSNPYESQTIPYQNSNSSQTNRFLSYFANGTYTYRERYILSGSARKDQSNIFGVNTNLKGVPLWSAGAAWILSRESFYKIPALPELKLRASYGYSGNLDNGITAYTTAQTASQVNYFAQQPYSYIINPPDPDLRWEKDRMVNFGVDFGTAKAILTGSLDYYLKSGVDLIGFSPVPPSTGLNSYQTNSADTRGRGFDLVLHSRNLTGRLKWNTTFLLTRVTDEVDKYQQTAGSIQYVSFAAGTAVVPLQGRPVYSLYSYRWAGLDPATGDPQGYYQGQVSKDYENIVNNTPPDSLVYNGPARPTVYGSVLNSFSWKGFSLSANISFEFGYYFRKSSIDYTQLLSAEGGNPDYNQRWQKPGDEKFTNVPSMPAQADPERDLFYLYSQALVEKGDNIRFQNISLSYDLDQTQWKKLPFRHIQIYGFLNNIGLLWKANKVGLDPDYTYLKPTRSASLGIKVNF